MVSKKSERRKLLGQRVLLAAASGLITLVLCEVVARVWVALRWEPVRVEALTTHSHERGRFASHPHLPFVLNPGFEGHNSLGFRGPEITPEKSSGTRRVACLGASTTYGLHVKPEEAWPAQLGDLLRVEHGKWEVINAGVLGWVSTDSLVNFVLRVLPLQPDVVVVYQNRNELFPQSYNDFKPDYTHYRRPGFSYTVSNYAHKLVFSYSHLAMLLCTVKGARFGWSEAEEHPLYGGLIHENRPSAAELKSNLIDSTRSETLRRSLQALCAICKAREIQILVTTMAYRPEQHPMASELDYDPAMLEPLAEQMRENNSIARQVAQESGAPMVDTATLAADDELFLDDCHLTAAGHRRRAEMIYEVLKGHL